MRKVSKTSFLEKKKSAWKLRDGHIIKYGDIKGEFSKARWKLAGKRGKQWYKLQ